MSLYSFLTNQGLENPQLSAQLQSNSLKQSIFELENTFCTNRAFRTVLAEFLRNDYKYEEL